MLLVMKGFVSVNCFRNSIFQQFADAVGMGDVFGRGHNQVMKRIKAASGAADGLVKELLSSSPFYGGQLDYYSYHGVSNLGIGVSGVADMEQIYLQHGATIDQEECKFRHFEIALSNKPVIRGRKTAEETRDRVIACMNQKEIPMKRFVAWVTDGDELATTKLLAQMSADGCHVLWCIAHLLNLVLCDTLDKHEFLLTKFRQINTEMRKIQEVVLLLQEEIIARSQSSRLRITKEYFNNEETDEEEADVIIAEGFVNVDQMAIDAGESIKKYPVDSFLYSIDTVIEHEGSDQVIPESKKQLTRSLNSIITGVTRWESWSRLANRLSRLKNAHVFDLFLKRFRELDDDEDKKTKLQQQPLYDLLSLVSTEEWSMIEFMARCMEIIVDGVLKPVQEQSQVAVFDVLSRLISCRSELMSLETGDNPSEARFISDLTSNLEFRTLGLIPGTPDRRHQRDMPTSMVVALVLSPSVALAKFPKQEDKERMKVMVERELRDMIVAMEKDRLYNESVAEVAQRKADKAEAEATKARQEADLFVAGNDEEGDARDKRDFEVSFGTMFRPRFPKMKRQRIGEIEDSVEALVERKLSAIKNQISSEFASYIALVECASYVDRICDEDGYSDTLKYWTNRMVEAPLIHKIIMRLGSMAVASVETERLFSVTTRLINQRNLQGDTLELFTLMSQHVNQFEKLGLLDVFITALIETMSKFCKN